MLDGYLLYTGGWSYASGCGRELTRRLVSIPCRTVSGAPVLLDDLVTTLVAFSSCISS